MLDNKMELAHKEEVWNKLMDLLDIISLKLLEKKQKNEWMNSIEAAGFLRVSKRTLQNYRTNGMVKFYRMHGKVFYRMSDLEKLFSNT